MRPTADAGRVAEGEKRQDFATADRLRDELDSVGIDAEEERPDERRGPPSPESPPSPISWTGAPHQPILLGVDAVVAAAAAPSGTTG